MKLYIRERSLTSGIYCTLSRHSKYFSEFMKPMFIGYNYFMKQTFGNADRFISINHKANEVGTSELSHDDI